MRWNNNQLAERRKEMPNKCLKESTPEMAGVVITTSNDFDVDNVDDQNELLEKVREAITNELKPAFQSSGVLRLKGAKRNC